MENHQIDWGAFADHLIRTIEVGLIPAVNMDTGFVNLLDDDTRREILHRTSNILQGHSFVAGAFIADEPGVDFNREAYCRQIDLIQAYGATPVIFPSFGLTRQSNDEIVGAYQALAAHCAQFIAFELGAMFAPCGKIYDLENFAGLSLIKNRIRLFYKGFFIVFYMQAGHTIRAVD